MMINIILKTYNTSWKFIFDTEENKSDSKLVKDLADIFSFFSNQTWTIVPAFMGEVTVMTSARLVTSAANIA